jgi:hypothetical protein
LFAGQHLTNADLQAFDESSRLQKAKKLSSRSQYKVKTS